MEDVEEELGDTLYAKAWGSRQLGMPRTDTALPMGAESASLGGKRLWVR